MRTRAVLLDLDGTLTDPRPGIVRSIRHALDRLRRPCPDDDVLATCIGPPLRGSFGRLLQTTDPACIEQAMGFYRERFAEVGLYENEVYAGIPAMLDALGSTGGRLYVATAKPAVFAERIVRHFALDHHFAGVYGPDLDGHLDDKADLLATCSPPSASTTATRSWSATAPTTWRPPTPTPCARSASSGATAPAPSYSPPAPAPCATPSKTSPRASRRTNTPCDR